MRKFLSSFISDKRGAAAIEYVLIAGLIGLAITVGAGALGTDLNNAMTTIAAAVTTAAAS